MTVATSLHDDVGAAVPDLTVQVAYDFAAASVVAVEVSAGEPRCQGTVYSVEVPTDVRLADLDLAFSRAGLFKVASADAVGLYPRWAGTILNPGYGFGFSGDDAVALHDFWFPGLESGVDSVDGGVDGVSGTAGVRFVGSSDIELQGTAEAHPADP